jgi:PAS domain S-box-containing protein
MQLKRGDGALRTVRVNAAPVRDEVGRIRSAVAVFDDVTDENRAREELRQIQRRYYAVLRATNEVIWDYDPATGQLTWNGALERVLGHRSEDIIRDPRGSYGWWLDHVHPDDRETVRDEYDRARAGGADSWMGQYRFRRADGSYVPTLDRCVFERDESGKLVRIIGAISDLSEEQRLLAELREAVTVRDDFLSCAGHELRTPLATLSAVLIGLRTLPLDETRRTHKLAAAERQVARLSTLVDELLNVSRIVHGKLRLERERVDLAALVHEAAARLADDFQRAETPLTIDAAEPVLGQWDRLRIDLVITNLLTNALRYGERRPVHVAVDRAGATGRLMVEDRGIGIRPEDRERIFERYVRAVPSRQYGGLGVGLWLSRQIVEAHGGRLQVESEAGAGSRFIVELPMEVR